MRNINTWNSGLQFIHPGQNIIQRLTTQRMLIRRNDNHILVKPRKVGNKRFRLDVPREGALHPVHNIVNLSHQLSSSSAPSLMSPNPFHGSKLFGGDLARFPEPDLQVEEACGPNLQGMDTH